MTASIVVVNFNGWEDTRLCLQSLAQLTVRAQVVMVDNGSRDDRCAAFRREFPQVQVIRNEFNGGWAGGNNTGILHSLEQGAEQIILLNNDTTVSPKLVETLLTAAQAHPDFGILGPVICFMDEPETVMTDGCVFNHPDREGFFQREPVALTPLQQITEVEIVNGCCMMISPELIRTIGLIDERFFLIHEESDFCLRAREAGFRCGVIGEALVWHKGSSSFQRTGKRIQRYYDARNLYLLLDKHVDEQPLGRGRISSMTAYLRYVYHRWSIERENGNADAANAVVEGLYDAVSARFGPMQNRGRWGIGFVRGLFEKMHQLRSR